MLNTVLFVLLLQYISLFQVFRLIRNYAGGLYSNPRLVRLREIRARKVETNLCRTICWMGLPSRVSGSYTFRKFPLRYPLTGPLGPLSISEKITERTGSRPSDQLA